MNAPSRRSEYDTAISPPQVPFCSLTIDNAHPLAPSMVTYLLDAVAERGEVEYRGGQYVVSLELDPIDRIVLPTLDPDAVRVWLFFEPEPEVD